ncbi:MAG TPA: hypothetical protein VFT66_26250 [Roseiflexaceae bacterium]|nr:hypothetical protein [Roseiflexaceae bacterium]
MLGTLSRMLLLGVLALLVIGIVAYVALHVEPKRSSVSDMAATATALRYPPGTREYYYWNQGQQQPAPEPPQQ